MATPHFLGAVAGNGGTNIDFSTLGLTDGDLLLYQVVAPGGAALTTPPWWTVLVDNNGFQARWIIAYRIWGTGDATTVAATGDRTYVSAYRDVDRTTPFSDHGFGPLTISDAASRILDFVWNQSLSSFTWGAPAGDTLRYGIVSAGLGGGLADLTGYTGSRSLPTWTMTGGGSPPGTTSRYMAVLQPGTPVAAGSGWSVWIG